MKQYLTIEDLKEYITSFNKFKKVIESVKIEWFSAGVFDKSWLEELASNLTIGILLEAVEEHITKINKDMYRSCWVLHTDSPSMRISKEELIDCLWLFLRARLGRWRSIKKEEELE